MQASPLPFLGEGGATQSRRLYHLIRPSLTRGPPSPIKGEGVPISIAALTKAS
jgi:hypothetical protein